jgi:transposase-like protein
MPVTCSEIEELVIAACRDLQTQEIPNIKATARKHGAPPGRVYRRWNCLAESRIDAGEANKVLDDAAAKQALCLYINFTD